MPTQQIIKEKISKILIKWSMPTRQVAIVEILELFKAQNQKLIEEIEKHLEEFEIPKGNWYDLKQKIKNLIK